MDFVLSSWSGEGWKESWLCVKPFGRFVDFQRSSTDFNAALSAKNVSFVSVDIGLVLETGNAILKAAMSTEKLLEAKSITALPLRVRKLPDITQAFGDVQHERFIGKTIVELEENAAVPVLLGTKPSYTFNSDASYVISGGLGGLGRSIVRWMADRQAKHFVLLSRSGVEDKAAVGLIEEMNLRHVKVATPACDIGSEDAVSTMLDIMRRSMPPIKGCIQASMVLMCHVGRNLRNMSLEDFNVAVKPKVQGSWHLHGHSPQDMDCFVLLSSITGITGSRGQRNYARGNTFQDALARHRVSKGQKCISLDLGAILSIGFAAERDLSVALEKEGFQGIRKSEFFALLEYVCNPQLPVATPMTSQIVTGLGGIEQMTADQLQKVYWTKKPLFNILRNENHANTMPSTNLTSAINYEELIKSAVSQAAAETVVVQALIKKLAAGLSISEEDIDVDKAIYNFGIDSLVALELRYWFIKEMNADVTIFDIMHSQNVLSLGKLAAAKSKFRHDIAQGNGREDGEGT